MNAKERTEWLKAVGACLPGVDTAGMAALAEAVDAACPGRWEASVCGRGPRVAGLRFLGAGGYAGFREALRASGGPDAPREELPWLAATWDLETGRRLSLRLYGGAKPTAWDFDAKGKELRRVPLKPAKFDARIFDEPLLERALSDFAALSPIASMTLEPAGWALKLASPPRWPLFARCDVSAGFAPASSQLALFLLDRKVTELSFDGEALWAHCAG